MLPLQDAFGALFFVSVGMLFDPAVLVREPLRVLAVIGIIVIGKSIAALGHHARCCGGSLKTALTVSAALAQIGEFSFILATLGVALGLLSVESQSLIVAGALISITINPLVFSARRPLDAEDGGIGPLRVLVLGGSGFVGSAAVRALRRRGAEVATFHRSETATIRGDRADLTAHRKAFAGFGPDAALDTIAYTEKEAAALVSALRGLARRIVVLSSQDVYASYGRLLGLEPGSADPAPAAEDAPLRTSRYPYRAAARPGEMAYDYEKILVEQAAASEPTLPATILRLPCVYGTGDPHHRIGQVLARIREGEPLPIDRTKAGWRWTRGAVENVGESIALAVLDRPGVGPDLRRGRGDGAERRGVDEAHPRGSRPVGRDSPRLTRRAAAGAAEPYDFRHDLIADTGRIRRELGDRAVVGRDARSPRPSRGSARAASRRAIDPVSAGGPGRP